MRTHLLLSLGLVFLALAPSAAALAATTEEASADASCKYVPGTGVAVCRYNNYRGDACIGVSIGFYIEECFSRAAIQLLA